eukprot:2767593-Alexandrium_andersonii.AAC.1
MQPIAVLRMAGTRQRADIEPELIADVLRPYVRSATWFRYAERLDAPLRADVLCAHRRWILQLRGLQANLSFTQAALVKVFHSLCRPEWALTREQTEDWAKTMAKRVRAACRHVQQSSIKRPG